MKTVYCINLHNAKITQVKLVTRNNEFFITDDYFGKLLIPMKAIHQKLSHEELYGTEWVCETSVPSVYIASSSSQSIVFLNKHVADLQSQIGKVEAMLRVFDSDSESIKAAVQDVMPPGTVLHVGDPNEDCVHVGGGRIDIEDFDYKKTAVNIRQIIETSLGISMDAIEGPVIIVSVKGRFVNFYIHRETLQQVSSKLQELDEIATKLNEIWSSADNFKITFVHHVPCDDYDWKYFKQASKPYYLSLNPTYQEILSCISRQMPYALNDAGRKSIKNKSKHTPHAFAVSRKAADKHAAGWNHFVFDYAAGTSSDTKTYYGLTSPMIVECHRRLDGTVYIKLAPDPEHVVKMTESQYLHAVKQKTSTLDAMMEMCV